MLTSNSHIHRSSSRSQETQHEFTAPVVRENPRPAPEPLSWRACW